MVLLTARRVDPLIRTLGVYMVTITLRPGLTVTMDLVAVDEVDARSLTKMYVRSLPEGVTFTIDRKGEKLVTLKVENEAREAAYRARRSLEERV